MICRSVIYSTYAVFIFTWCTVALADVASEAPSVQDLQRKLADALPEGLPVNASQVPSQEEVQEKLKEKCDRVGGPGAFDRVQNAQEDVKTCVMSLVNVTELQQEMEAAKPTGDLDIVFRKYCRKSGTFKGCISNFTSTIDLCLEEKEKESKIIVQNITEALLEFLCYKEGDRIALFIAEGGPECIQLKQEKIQNCVNSTVGKNMPTQESESGKLSHIPLMVIGEKECSSLEELKHCVVTSLEECSEPTPANIVESLMQFIMKMIPNCKERKVRIASASMASGSPEIRKIPVLYLTALMFLARKLVS